MTRTFAGILSVLEDLKAVQSEANVKRKVWVIGPPLLEEFLQLLQNKENSVEYELLHNEEIVSSLQKCCECLYHLVFSVSDEGSIQKAGGLQ